MLYVKTCVHKDKAERVKILSIAEQYIDINEEYCANKPLKGKLITYDIGVLRTYFNQIMTDIESLLNDIRNEYGDKIECFQLAYMKYSNLKSFEVVDAGYGECVYSAIEKMN